MFTGLTYENQGYFHAKYYESSSGDPDSRGAGPDFILNVA
jgi:hypothetical protein